MAKHKTPARDPQTGAFLKSTSSRGRALATKGKGKHKRGAIAAFFASKPPKGAMRNPATPRGERKVFGGAFFSAVVGGGIAFLGRALLQRAVSAPGATDVVGVVVPGLIGAGLTQIKHKHSAAMAAGAFGVAGASVAETAGAMISGKANPPGGAWDGTWDPAYLPNPVGDRSLMIAPAWMSPD